MACLIGCLHANVANPVSILNFAEHELIETCSVDKKRDSRGVVVTVDHRDGRGARPHAHDRSIALAPRTDVRPHSRRKNIKSNQASHKTYTTPPRVREEPIITVPITLIYPLQIRKKSYNVSVRKSECTLNEWSKKANARLVKPSNLTIINSDMPNEPEKSMEE